MARQYKTKYKVKWVRKLNKCRTVRQFLDLRNEFYIENQYRFLSTNVSTWNQVYRYFSEDGLNYMI